MAQEPEVQIDAQDLKIEEMQDTDNFFGKGKPYDFVLDENGDVFYGPSLDGI
jgi:hypothetical protein